MLKRISCALIMAATLVVLCSCARSENLLGLLEGPASQEAADEASSAQSAETASSASAASSAPSSPARSYALTDRADNKAIRHDFSEGRAWVEFQKDDHDYLGVIDETGRLVYQVDLDKLEEDARNGKNDFNQVSMPNMITTAWFQDGVSYYGPSGTLLDYADQGFVIIDKDGNELFKSDDGDESTDFTMLGFADGAFVVRERITDFSHNDDVFFAMDAHGNRLTDEFVVELSGYTSDREFEYFGEGIFCDGSYILNVETNSLVDMTYHDIHIGLPSCVPMTPFYEGRALTENNAIVTPADYASQEAAYAFEERAMNESYSSTAPFSRIGMFDDVLDSWGEGLVFGWMYDDSYNMHTGWFDLNGNLVVPAPEYAEGISIVSAGNFSGGYAPIELRGKDGDFYITAVDRSGSQLFEPMRGVLYGSYALGYVPICRDGYFCGASETALAENAAGTSGSPLLVDYRGELHALGPDTPVGFNKDTRLSVGDDERIMGGYVYRVDQSAGPRTGIAPASFIGIDGETVIDSCYER